MINIPTKLDPVLIDAAIDTINLKLSELTWLTQAFGKIERLVEVGKSDRSIKGSGRNTLRYPAIFKGGSSDDYEKMFPDEDKGNFSYVEVKPRENVEDLGHTYDIYDEIGIVFWFRFDKVYTGGDDDQFTTENVKKQVLDKLSGFRGIVFNVTGIVEGAEQIYEGFHHNEINQQFLMRPYGGFKVLAKIKHTQLCQV